MGEGVEADLVKSYAWLSIVKTQGYLDASGLEGREGVVKAAMTAQEIRESQALAREYWEKFVLPARARARAKAEIALQKAIAQDARAEREFAGRAEYIAQIADKIGRNWLRPPGAAPGLKCIVRVSQIPGGEIVRAEIVTGSGDLAFDRSVQKAVMDSSPLAGPKDPALFDRHIVITFEPEV